MYRVFEKSEPGYEFSKEAVGNFDQFLWELAGYAHNISKASASVIAKLEENESSGLAFLWGEVIGNERGLLKSINSEELVSAGMRVAIEKGIETCLIHDRETGAVRQLQAVPKDLSMSFRSAAAAPEIRVRTQDLETPLEAAPASNGPSEPEPEPTNNETPADGVTQYAASQFTATQDIDPSIGATQGSAFSQPRTEKVVSFLWIRPLSNNHVLLSICPKGSRYKTLKHMFQNAHSARNLFNARLEAEQHSKDSRKILRLAEEVTSQLPFTEQAFLQANEIRRYLGCDRVTIFEINNASATVLAVSGQPKFNPRSNSIRTGQNMVGRIIKTGEPFWFAGSFEELADSLQEAVRRYTDESLVNSFVLFPLIQSNTPVYPSEEETMLEAINPGTASDRKTIGAVLVEQIEDVVERPVIEKRWENIHRLVLNQYNNSRKYDSIFLVRFWTMMGRFAALYRGQTKRKAIAITSLIAALLLGSLLIPSDFKIRCEGYLVFDKTMEMYSKNDGNVVKLNVFDGKPVNKGDVLLVQENLSLSRENAELDGEIAQKETEIIDLNDARTRSYLSAESNQQDSAVSLAQRVFQLEVELNELKQQKQLLRYEMEQLLVRAPYDGTIAGWKTERRLLGRPLDKGTHLFSLIPSDASFKLELRVPDQRAGYVQHAWFKAQESDKDLPVTFRLASAPGENRKAVVNFVSPGLERDEHIGYSLPIYAMATDEIPRSERKSRTAVLAQVICGRHSLAYCKSYEAIDWVRSKFFEFSF